MSPRTDGGGDEYINPMTKSGAAGGAEDSGDGTDSEDPAKKD
jgi:hypothetical protein